MGGKAIPSSIMAGPVVRCNPRQAEFGVRGSRKGPRKTGAFSAKAPVVLVIGGWESGGFLVFVFG